MLLLKLLALFVLVPLTELWLLLLLAKHTSPLTTLAVVVVTGVAGTALARAQGWRTLRKIQDELSQGALPTDSLLDAALIFCAGALLLTPGMLTDAVGLALLIPALRHRFRARLVRWMRQRFHVSTFSAASPPERSRVIDAHVIKASEEESEGDGRSPNDK